MTFTHTFIPKYLLLKKTLNTPEVTFQTRYWRVLQTKIIEDKEWTDNRSIGPTVYTLEINSFRIDTSALLVTRSE